MLENAGKPVLLRAFAEQARRLASGQACSTRQPGTLSPGAPW